jgi:hypothetical protein
VFKHLLNEAAFIDRIGLSVWSNQKPNLDLLLDSKNIGILTPKSLYARCLTGNSPLTGNPVRMQYAKISRFPRVPPLSIGMRSETLPLTGAQVNEILRQLVPGAVKIQPVYVELTFVSSGLKR